MRRIFNQQLFVYALCATLLLTLGMEFKAPAQAAERSVATIQPLNRNEINSEISRWHKVMYQVISKLHSSTTKSNSSSPAVPEQLQKSVAKPVPVAEKPSTTSYEVTADYLNVRTGPTVASKRVKVVEQGTILDVVQTTKEGWLQLKAGGYVHGGYAKIIHIDIADQSSLEKELVKRPPVLKPNLTPKPKPKLIQHEPSKPTSTVKSDSGLTEAHIAQIFKGTALAGHDLESAILEVEEEYGINAYFTIAVMKLESGNGKSSLAKNKNNLFGLNATGGNNKNANSFKTKGASVQRFGQLLSKNYVKKGYTSVEKVATKYCPANPKWASLVKNIMKRDYNKL
ncbi:hypothetical protein BVG16_22070 [Paenibacillus selenitireducens]|uniref:SH3b domain-containing protein n=1 Tax=Paenibacillus selenitireducens TaxID=1324314 RepID=A0A1T2X6I1_9BACL|nr:glucosaminidase domain-containing protein [Paenibacillus selenitireducens]OPA75286.1 hypothetical protein BVG16_22070 [Paenibacillus selenitireducens]